MTPHQDLYLLVLESAPALHPERRARIFRALADIIGDERFAADLIKRAEANEAVQKADGQLPLSFTQAIDGGKAA